MNLIEGLIQAATLGYKEASMDVGLGLQTWTIEELISNSKAQQSRLPDEDSIAGDVEDSEYVESEWIVDAENASIERLDYTGARTGDIYKLH
jgi:hypothetical protein